MRRLLLLVILIVNAMIGVASCGSAEVKKDGPTTRDRANQSFQELEREESQQCQDCSR